MTGPILLEGPDGGGKTTLAARLAAELGLEVVKNGPPVVEMTSARLYALYASQLRPGVVIDRAWPSEQVYAPLFRRKCLTSERAGVELWRRFGEVGGAAVLCLPPLHACLEAIRTRGDDLVDDETLRRAWAQYAGISRTLAIAKKYAGAAHFVHDRTLAGEDERLIEWLRELAR
jgi:hypothetical protein